MAKTGLDARSLVEQTLHLVHGPARHRSVTVDWQPPPEVVTIEADPVQMRQVLLNLLINALDAAGENGKVTIEIAAPWNLPRAGLGEDGKADNLPWVAIHVTDTGPGVPDDKKAQIFQPFVSTKDTGMGLGLAVSRRIVESHGGALVVTDNPGGGARFTICLPPSHSGIASPIEMQAGSD